MYDPQVKESIYASFTVRQPREKDKSIYVIVLQSYGESGKVTVVLP